MQCVLPLNRFLADLQVAAEAAADIQRLQTEVLTENNVKALRESVQTLTKTLQHIERITGTCRGRDVHGTAVHAGVGRGGTQAAWAASASGRPEE